MKGRPAVHLQSFEEASIRRLAELMPTVPRTFLIGTPDAAARWLTPAALQEMRTFATGVGPARQLIERTSRPRRTGPRRGPDGRPLDVPTGHRHA